MRKLVEDEMPIMNGKEITEMVEENAEI